VPDNVHQLHVLITFHLWKTRGCQCGFRLVMMGDVSPETCWASYKYGIVKFDTLLHLVGFFFMNFTMMHGSTNVKYEPVLDIYHRGDANWFIAVGEANSEISVHVGCFCSKTRIRLPSNQSSYDALIFNYDTVYICLFVLVFAMLWTALYR